MNQLADPDKTCQNRKSAANLTRIGFKKKNCTPPNPVLTFPGGIFRTRNLGIWEIGILRPWFWTVVAGILFQSKS